MFNVESTIIIEEAGDIAEQVLAIFKSKRVEECHTMIKETFVHFDHSCECVYSTYEVSGKTILLKQEARYQVVGAMTFVYIGEEV